MPASWCAQGVSSAPPSSSSSSSSSSPSQSDPDARFMVRLRGLKHPLLHGTYLKQRQALERRVRQEGGTLPSSATGNALLGGRGGRGGASSRRMLGTRRETMLAGMGLAAAPPEGGAGRSEASAEGEPSAQVRGGVSGKSPPPPPHTHTLSRL